jgi:hypothetical protein
MVWSILFISVALTLCLASALAIFGITHINMSGPAAIARDGLPRGGRAPAWTLTDSSGHVHVSPPLNQPIQLIVFSDHSLKSFPSVADGLRQLLRSTTGLDIVILMRRPSDRAASVLEMLGLATIPILTGSQSLYGRYNVRVMPFVMFVDSYGRVRGSSLVNHAWQVTSLYRVAQIPPPQLATSESAVLPTGILAHRRGRRQAS